MTVRPLHTLRAIARELDLPESTVRYYRDAFDPWLPCVGRGRRRRYPSEALPLFRLIAEGYAQNRSRLEIEAALGEVRGEPAATPEIPTSRAPAPQLVRADAYWPSDNHAQLLATILDGERERREVMWQMAREIVRLGEAIERQHEVLAEVARRLDGDGNRALPAAAPAAPPDPGPSLVAQLESLRRELTQERDLVDRLRRSKLEIERRAALAEAALEGPNGPRSP